MFLNQRARVVPCAPKLLNKMRVIKFGGTSVQNATNINKAIAIIREKMTDDKLLVVVSAFGGITNKLIEVSNLAAKGDNTYTTILKDIETRHIDAIKELVKSDKQNNVIEHTRMTLKNFDDLLHGVFLLQELSPRTLDMVMSFGERLSAYIIAQALKEQGINAEFLDSRDVVKTDKNFGTAKVNFELTNKLIKQHVGDGVKLFVATGFISSTVDCETTTLGRGGSDYSGAIFAGALDAKVLEIWTDVDGMMTADPRKVKKAYPIKHISYAEAMELSHFGAKVLEPRTVLPAMSKQIPILIKNTFNPTAEGTLITEKAPANNLSIRGISSIDNVSLITVQGSGMIGEAGISMRLFQAIARQHINVILITQCSSEHSITFAVLPLDADRAKKCLEAEFELEIKLKLIDSILMEDDLAVIAVVGENMKSIPGISAKLFTALGRNGVNVMAIAQGASELNISVVISNVDKIKALTSIHEMFFLSDVKTVNVFVVGTGTIGGALLKQINAQRSTLVQKNGIDVKVAGISNIDGFLIDEDGIDLDSWEATMKEKGRKPVFSDFVAAVKDLNLRNSVFVDNTASADVAAVYEELLEKSISVVTPNKIANASDINRYNRLHAISAKTGARFLYETNVGAGLPVISTLKDLINSGDEIIKIEAILSGSLNYIFSNVSSKKDFATAVNEARDKGFTEPDPKIDLSGKDVARKILILSREIGKQINLEDIEISNCLSPESQKTETWDALSKTLVEFDNKEYAKIIQQAEAKGNRLKYIASFENGKSSTAVKEIDASHPFFNVLGSDNIISFTTSRYKTNPLIVIGPGAGAEVTAAGVFADIIRIVNY